MIKKINIFTYLNNIILKKLIYKKENKYINGYF